MSTRLQDDPCEAMKILKGYWSVLIYRKKEELQVEDLKWKFFSNLTGQGVFICGMHDVPLTKDFVKSGLFCRCQRVSHLRCPIPKCTSCVCRQHFDEGLKNPNRLVVFGKNPLTLEEGRNQENKSGKIESSVNESGSDTVSKHVSDYAENTSSCTCNCESAQSMEIGQYQNKEIEEPMRTMTKLNVNGSESVDG